MWYLNPKQVAFTFIDNILDKQIKKHSYKPIVFFLKKNNDDKNNCRIVKSEIALNKAYSILDNEVDYFTTLLN